MLANALPGAPDRGAGESNAESGAAPRTHLPPHACPAISRPSGDAIEPRVRARRRRGRRVSDSSSPAPGRAPRPAVILTGGARSSTRGSRAGELLEVLRYYAVYARIDPDDAFVALALAERVEGRVQPRAESQRRTG